jgi:hypothetical protein
MLGYGESSGVLGIAAVTLNLISAAEPVPAAASVAARTGAALAVPLTVERVWHMPMSPPVVVSGSVAGSCVFVKVTPVAVGVMCEAQGVQASDMKAANVMQWSPVTMPGLDPAVTEKPVPLVASPPPTMTGVSHVSLGSLRKPIVP